MATSIASQSITITPDMTDFADLLEAGVREAVAEVTERLAAPAVTTKRKTCGLCGIPLKGVDLSVHVAWHADPI